MAETVPALLFSRLVGGLMAGNIPVAFAAASDVTSGKDRSMIMGRVGAAFSLGFIFGPAIGGLLAGPNPQATNFLLIAMLAAGLCLFAVLVTIVSFRETHPKEKRSAKPVSLRLISLKGAGRYLTLPVLGVLIGLNFMFVAGASMMDSTFALYAFKEHGFGPNDIGFLFTYMGIVMAIVQGGTIGPLTRRFGDAQVLRAGLFIYTIGLGLMVVATGLYSVLLSLTFLTIGNALFVPASSSLASQHAPGSEQGAALGVFQAAGNLGRVLTPAFSGVIFASYGTTAAFIVAIALLLPTFFLIRLAIMQGKVVSAETSS
ncbi:MAG: MFS transporter [Rhodospirillaceae bacterium]|nr:MFS transporter [Rhodospirillaceae bacterium]